MLTRVFTKPSKFIYTLTLILTFVGLATLPLMGQEVDSQIDNDSILPLRSDVGIVGLTANLDWWNKFYYMQSDTTLTGVSNHEVEIVFRDVRMLTQRLGVGFMVMGSFFADGSDFGIGGWGLGPVIRAYPFRTDQFLPYLQAQALLGNNMGIGELADTRNEGKGFRVRLAIKAGLAVRFSNNFGIFVEFGPAWGSSSLFKADARVWQLNIGFDLYRFKQ